MSRSKGLETGVWGFNASVNKCVFNRRLKSSLLTARSHKLSSNEFQTDEPATRKACGPDTRGQA